MGTNINHKVKCNSFTNEPHDIKTQIKLKVSLTDLFYYFQELREAYPTAERHQDPTEKLRCLPQAEELAVVETVP